VVRTSRCGDVSLFLTIFRVPDGRGRWKQFQPIREQMVIYLSRLLVACVHEPPGPVPGAAPWPAAAVRRVRRLRSGIEVHSARLARNARSGPAARGLLFTNPLVRFPAPHHGRRLAFSGVRRWRSGIEVNLPSLAALARNARSGPAARDLLFTNPLVRFPAPHHGRRLAFSGVRRWRSGIEANSARLATFARDARSAPGSLL